MIICLYRHCNDVVIIIVQVQSTPLHQAAYSGHTDTVALLVKSGANVNMKDMVSSGVY